MGLRPAAGGAGPGSDDSLMTVGDPLHSPIRGLSPNPKRAHMIGKVARWICRLSQPEAVWWQWCLRRRCRVTVTVPLSL